mgnify:FL=1
MARRKNLRKRRLLKRHSEKKDESERDTTPKYTLKKARKSVSIRVSEKDTARRKGLRKRYSEKEGPIFRSKI